MYGNQLEFKQQNNNCLIHQKEDEYNFMTNNAHHNYYMDDLKKLHLEEHIKDNNLNLRQNSNFPIEQLEYYNKEDYDRRGCASAYMQLKDTPKPLVFNKTKSGIKNNPKNKKIKTFSNKSIAANYNKNKKQERKLPLTNLAIKNINISNTFNITSCNKSVNGLFDPNLKRNELDLPKRSQLQRMERTDKIKNYDLKFGTKFKKLQMYNNYMDVLEDLEQINDDRKLKKKDFSNFNPTRSKNLEKIKELEEKMPKALKIPVDNLDFDFDSHEQVIRSLEQQIQNERKMRTEVNLKYFQKMKEFENLQNLQNKSSNEQNQIKIVSKLTPVNKKSKTIAKRYAIGNRKTRNRKKKVVQSSFKSEINKSINLVDKNMILSLNNVHTRRNKSFDLINEKMKDLSPRIDKIIDKSFSGINKSILINNKKLMKNAYQSTNNLNLRSSKMNPYLSEAPQSINVISPINNNTNFLSENNIDSCQNMQNFYANDHQINQSLNNNYMSALPNQIFNHESHFRQNNTANRGNILYSYSQNNQIENNNNLSNLEVIASLNKDIAKYNKGLPQLIEKVESTIQKITKNDIFNSDKIHPLIQMASKHTGQSVHLHIDQIMDCLLDELLFDSVQVLQEIEDRQNKKQDYQNFKNYIKDYYQDFEMMKNLELDITKKLCSKAKYYPEIQKPESKINSYPKVIIEERQHHHNSNMIKIENIHLENLEKFNDYKNPFNNNLESCISNNYKEKNMKNKMITRYKTIANPKLTKNLENYLKSYVEHMKVTGAFLVPNIFCFYEDLTKEIVNEALDEELDYCIKQLDSFVTDIYKEEVNNINK